MRECLRPSVDTAFRLKLLLSRCTMVEPRDRFGIDFVCFNFISFLIRWPVDSFTYASRYKELHDPNQGLTRRDNQTSDHHISQVSGV